MREILAEYNDEDIDIGKDANFIDFYTQWLETMKLSVAPTTHDGYSYILQSHMQPYFGKKRLKVRDVTPTVIQNYVNGKH